MPSRPPAVPLRLLAVILTAVGIGAIWLGWFGAAGYDWVPAQLPYLISGGFAGLGMVIAGVSLFLVDVIQRSASSRAEELAALRRELGEALDLGPSDGHDDAGVLALPSDGSNSLVYASGITFHRPSCRYVQGREGSLRMMELPAATTAGLSACRVCEPTHEGQVST